MDDSTAVCLIGCLLGLIPAFIAKEKGHDFTLWWIFGAALFIVALPVALLISPKSKEIPQSESVIEKRGKCPYCAELIKEDAVVCRFCGRGLPLLGSIALELHSLAQNNANIAKILEEEIPKWKWGFSKIGWQEEIGKNTKIALSNASDQYGILNEPLLCVTYANVKGSRISNVTYNHADFYSPVTALIATTNRIVIVQPKTNAVKVVEYRKIKRIDINGMSNIKSYTFTTVSGDLIEIEIIFENTDDLLVVDSFLLRISALAQKSTIAHAHSE